MKYEKRAFLILFASFLLVTIIIPPFSHANPGGGPIIWSAERQLSYDPWEIIFEPDPPPGHNATVEYVDSDMMPSVIVTKDNKIWTVWQTDETGNLEIFYEYYDRFINETMAIGTQLTFNSGQDYAPAILQTQDNKIWVFWDSDRNGNNEIYYKTTTNNGASWSTETQVTDDPRSDFNPSVTQTSDGKIWLVWSRQVTINNQDLFYKTFDGATWTADTQLTTNTNRDELPSIVQAQDGKIWVFWSEYMPDTHEQICYKNFNGSTWSSETQLTTDEKDNIDPAVLVEKDGTIRVYWASKTQQTQATFQLFYKISLDNGTTWSASVQFTDSKNQYDDMQPSVAQALDGSLWVVWMSTRVDSMGYTNIDLYHKFSILGDVSGLTGVPDGVIDVYDLDTIKKAMPTTPASPHGTDWGQWNAICDLNVDNVIDIEDFVIASVSFGSQA